MNQAHFHLVINHFPIIGLMIGSLVILIGLLSKKSSSTQVGLFIVVGSALAGIPAFFTGEGAEEIVEEINGVSGKLIHDHEELAELFIWILSITGALALLNLLLYWKEKAMSIKFSWLVLGACIVSNVFAKQVGTSGGEIRHSEIRNNYDPSIQNPEFTKPKKYDDD